MGEEAIEFSSSGGRVKISWDFDGDYVVAIDAKAYGFRGHSDGHVVLDEFKAFAKNILRLAKSRQGQAKFSSASPDLFDVTVQSIDGVGHFGVFGSLTMKYGDSFDEQQTLQFSLHFEPAQIENIAVALRQLTT